VKLISTILSLYILALITVPCCSFDNCPEDKTESAQTASHDKEDENSEGACSPFFSCEGCISATNITEPITFSPHIIIPAETNYAGLTFSYRSYDFHSIWQPPQLV